MKRLLQSGLIHTLLALLTGAGLGLAYSWFISPVSYVDAAPSILRADFKDQYRIIIASAYAANQDLARASARLGLLGDEDPIGALSAQAQRMLAAGEPFENAEPLAKLATDLKQGVVSEPFTPTAFPTFNTPDIPPTSTPIEITPESTDEVAVTATPTNILFEQTPLTPVINSTRTPRPAFTPTAGPGAPYTLVSQETICQPGFESGLLQFILMNARKQQTPGVEIIITWDQGEDRFFTGFKSELGNGYADFNMVEGVVYNIRIVAGGTTLPNIMAPACTDPNGQTYLGGLLLTFSQE